MLSLFDLSQALEIRERINRLQADTARHWGTMTVSQVLAHMSYGMQLALGDKPLPRLLIGRVVGGLVKRLALRDDKPLRRNTPTDPHLVVSQSPDFEPQRTILLDLIDRFHSGGRAGCTTLPHSFFGKLTPDEWGVLCYKHMDHHLRQFGV